MRLVGSRGFLLAVVPAIICGQKPDCARVNREAIHHFQALVQIDSTDPPGNETRVAEYIKKTFEAEGIPVTSGRQRLGVRISSYV